MIIENGQIKNTPDPIDQQDAMTKHLADQAISSLPITWKNGVQMTNVKQYFGSATVAGGSVTFYLTDNGLSTGNAIFTNVYLESLNLLVSDSANMYNFSGITVAGNKKSLTVNVNRLGTVVAGIIQFLSAANGVTVYMQVNGD